MPNDTYKNLTQLCLTQEEREKQWKTGLFQAVSYLREQLGNELGVHKETFSYDQKQYSYMKITDANGKNVSALMTDVIDKNGIATIFSHLNLLLPKLSVVTWTTEIKVRYSERGAEYAIARTDSNHLEWKSGAKTFIDTYMETLIDDLRFDPLNRY
ncbi:hypothetical protein HJ184_09285 [Vibrio parahaemolyticus]|nr:hypothetical protein [Vibrio parahaemolyticus]